MNDPQKDKYGLMGILKVIRMTDPDLNQLALGMDLTTLGLNLNTPASLCKTFASPWTERQIDPAQKTTGYGTSSGSRAGVPSKLCSSSVVNNYSKRKNLEQANRQKVLVANKKNSTSTNSPNSGNIQATKISAKPSSANKLGPTGKNQPSSVNSGGFSTVSKIDAEKLRSNIEKQGYKTAAAGGIGQHSANTANLTGTTNITDYKYSILLIIRMVPNWFI